MRGMAPNVQGLIGRAMRGDMSCYDGAGLPVICPLVTYPGNDGKLATERLAKASTMKAFLTVYARQERDRIADLVAYEKEWLSELKQAYTGRKDRHNEDPEEKTVAGDIALGEERMRALSSLERQTGWGINAIDN